MVATPNYVLKTIAMMTNRRLIWVNRQTLCEWNPLIFMARRSKFGSNSCIVIVLSWRHRSHSFLIYFPLSFRDTFAAIPWSDVLHPPIFMADKLTETIFKLHRGWVVTETTLHPNDGDVQLGWWKRLVNTISVGEKTAFPHLRLKWI